MSREGIAYFAHGARGRPSNNSFPSDFRRLVLETLRSQYVGSSPREAQRLMKHFDGIEVNRGTLRNWMIKDGLWIPRRQRSTERATGGQNRLRATRPGEVIYIDGTEIIRAADRKVVALHAIDEATSALLSCRLELAETTHGYMQLMLSVCKRFGKMVVLVSDGHGSMVPRSRRAPTQFERALNDLGVVYRESNCPQSRAMVERVHRSVEPYLVSWLKRRNIPTLAKANESIDEFLTFFRSNFTVDPISNESAYRPATSEELADAWSWKSSCRLSLSGEAQLKNCIIQLDDACSEIWSTARRIEVSVNPDFQLRIAANGIAVRFRLLSRCRRYRLSQYHLASKVWNNPTNLADVSLLPS